MPGQSDVMQARWGSHGDYEIAAYSPWSPQEMFDLTVHAFNVADRFRIPVSGSRQKARRSSRGARGQ